MLGPDNELILWDSGLSFQHGPAGKECTSLFCGTEKWQEHGKEEYNLKRCAKVCRFRKETILQLQSLSVEKNIGRRYHYFISLLIINVLL